MVYGYGGFYGLCCNKTKMITTVVIVGVLIALDDKSAV